VKVGRAAVDRVLIALAVACAVGAVEVWAQRSGPAPRAREPFTFEFLAVDRMGEPIQNLTSDQVQLKLDGRVRTIRALEWVPIFDARTPDGRPALPLPPPFGTNTAHDGTRTLLFVIDDASFRPGRERPLRQVIHRFLGSLAPRDRVALVTVPFGGLKTDLTTEHEQVLVQLSNVVGQAPQTETGSDLACRTRRTLESLTGLLESLHGGEGPTTVLLFSSRLAGPRRDAIATRAPGGCELTVDHFRHVGNAASFARALFYVVQPDDTMLQSGANQTEGLFGGGFLGSDNPLEGLEHLAGVTGAHRLQLQTAEDMALERVSRETAGYYLLRFDVDDSDRDGLRRQVDLRVNGPGVSVRARPQFTIPRIEPGHSPPTPLSMLRQGRIFRGLPLRVLAYVSRNPGDDNLKIVMMVEPLEATVKIASVSAALLDSTGRAAAQWTSADPDARPLVGALVAPPGLYRVRVAATDTAGRAGTADYEVRGELVPAGGLNLSGVVLGLSREGAFAPRMEFMTEPSVLAHLELYGTPGSEPMWVSFELATTLNGPALVTTPGVIEGTRSSDRFVATGAVPISSLPPGDYVVRAVAGLKGQPAGRVLRTLRKKTVDSRQ
jgi:VWFA-related protein